MSFRYLEINTIKFYTSRLLKDMYFYKHNVISIPSVIFGENLSKA